MRTHHEVEQLREQAELQAWLGNTAAAQELFSLAAEENWAFVQSLPEGRPKCVAVYGTEALSLYLRAGDREKAQAVGRYLLEQPDLRPYDHDTVRRILRSE